MTRYDRIIKLLQSLNPSQILLIDESEKHSGHQHLGDRAHEGETHYSLVIVSSQFNGLSRLDRQRLVNSVLQVEFENGLHALQMKTYLPEEYGQTIA